MELEDQLTSLKPSKRLKGLGVKQDSFYHWSEGDNIVFGLHGHYKDNAHSAYSFTELYEVFATDLSKSQVNIHWNHNLFTVSFQGKMMFHHKKLADAMALLLIYLIENKLIKL